MINCILLDIEGTTSSIEYVHQTLFPYSFERMDSFLEEVNFSTNPDFKDLKEIITKVSSLPLNHNSDYSKVLKQWIAEDRKEGALKKVQGLIWQRGFESGELKGHFYDEVPEMLNFWKEQGVKLCVYSSGSIQAQKLYYRYSCFGDLSHLISFYFDTTSGPKRETQSYLTILESLSKSLGTISSVKTLFLTDIQEEAQAASSAGIKVCLVNRTGDNEIEATYPQIKSFKEIDLSQF